MSSPRSTPLAKRATAAPEQKKRQHNSLTGSRSSSRDSPRYFTATHLHDSLGRFLSDSSSPPPLDISPLTTPPPSAAR